MTGQMTLNDYQTEALKTLNARPMKYDTLAHGVIGLCNEAGEVAGILKKHAFQGHSMDPKDMADELGDVLWYLTIVAKELGYTLEDIAAMNLKKLTNRYPKGFEVSRSINRVKTPAMTNGFDPYPHGSIVYDVLFKACDPKLKIMRLDEENKKLEAEITLFNPEYPGLQSLDNTIPPYNTADVNLENIKHLSTLFYEKRLSAFDATISAVTERYMDQKRRHLTDETTSQFEVDLNKMLRAFLCSNFGTLEQFAVVFASTIVAWFDECMNGDCVHTGLAPNLV